MQLPPGPGVERQLRLRSIEPGRFNRNLVFLSQKRQHCTPVLLVRDTVKRFSTGAPLATQTGGKRSPSINRRISCASWRSVFCLRSRFVRNPLHSRSTTQTATLRAVARTTSGPLAYIPTHNCPLGCENRDNNCSASSRCSSLHSCNSPVSVSTNAICWKPGW